MEDASRMPTNGEGIPVVALDIDGTLGDFHSHFLKFAEGWLDEPMPDPRQKNPGLSLWEFMGIDKRTYREVKLAYRQGGLKRTMPVYRGAAALTEAIQEAGAQVWICTTRPYLRLDNIDPDTREWLRRNKIRYNAVLFGEDKYEELARQVGHRVVAIVDDLPEMVRASLAINWQQVDSFPRIYVRDQPYNQAESLGLPQNNQIYRINDLRDLHAGLRIDIREWKEAQPS